MSRQHLCSGYVATLSCIIYISVATQKVHRDKGLLPRSLTSCCKLVLMLRHGFLVFIKYLLSQPRFHVATGLLCICVEISVATQKVCRDGVLPPLSIFPCSNFNFYVATWTFVLGMFYMSRPQICYVTMTLFCMHHIFLSRPSFSSCDITFLPSI